jgi:AraC family transcriptional activator of pobA
MKEYRPLLIENLGISLPGIEVLRLQLNEHLQGSGPENHSHGHGQLLVYLRGQGAQVVDGKRYDARSGTVIYAAPGKRHGFERERARSPLCLVLDVRFKSELQRPKPAVVGTLPATSLNHIRSRVTQLFAMKDLGKADRQLTVGAIILDVLDALLRTVGMLDARPAANAGHNSLTRSAEKVIMKFLPDPSADLALLARELGYQRDYLNRALKSECGLTLGQLRARMRLREAQRFLRSGKPVGEVACDVGIDDQNYFARWFRQQTGTSPSAWKRQPAITPA